MACLYAAPALPEELNPCASREPHASWAWFDVFFSSPLSFYLCLFPCSSNAVCIYSVKNDLLTSKPIPGRFFRWFHLSCLLPTLLLPSQEKVKSKGRGILNLFCFGAFGLRGKSFKPSQWGAEETRTQANLPPAAARWGSSSSLRSDQALGVTINSPC